jgi:hypothetical protein
MVPQTYLAAAQSVLAVHTVLHASALAHLKFPGQGPAVPALHAPLPLQVGAGVSEMPEQDAAPHFVPAA